MSNFKKSKAGIAILIIALILSTLTFASGTSKTIVALFNSVNLTVNGNKVNAETIVYNGTTYVPLRAAAEMLGKDVGWNQATQTASINDKSVVKPKPIESSGETLSQRNAVAKAKSYLDFTSFSKSGLIKQLEYESFSNKDATYAVNNISVDWKEQAVKKAKSYLDFTSFSKSGLIKQLEFDGFTNEEATYAVGQIGF